MRIAITNHLMLENLCQLILTVPGHEIAWVASNGYEAVEKCLFDTPDLLLIAPNMPIMDGVEATRRIMNESPCPILIVADSVEGDAAKVFEAMGYGALDAVSAPLIGSEARIEQSKIALLKKISTISKLQRYSSTKPGSESFRIFPTRQVPSLIVIGSSAGGPKTLATLLSQLPANLDAVIIIVQHVDQEFSGGLVNWLNAQTSLNVRLATDGNRPEPGSVYVAGTNQHLIVTRNLRFAYTSEPQHVPYHPSVDVLFNSAARHWPIKGSAILLTGMGRDGAEGLVMLRKAGWYTIAQDETSSVVYGMPRAAKELGAAEAILSIDEIVPTILKMLAVRCRVLGKKQ